MNKTKASFSKTNLLLHPIKDAVKLYGDDYNFSWEGVYVTFKFADAGCSFEAYVGTEFEQYDWYNNYIDINSCNVMEYLSFTVIDKVIIDGDVPFFNRVAQSGCYGYAGDKYYLMDSFIMDLTGSVLSITL